jgi:hypothetical protein
LRSLRLGGPARDVETDAPDAALPEEKVYE